MQSSKACVQKQQNRPAARRANVSQAEAYVRGIGGVITTDSAGLVVALQLPENTVLPEEVWQHIAQSTDMQELDLGAMHVINDNVNAIGKLVQLRTLNLFGNPLDSICLSYLSDLENLETLYLYRTFIDDEGLGAIRKFKKRKRLNTVEHV